VTNVYTAFKSFTSVIYGFNFGSSSSTVTGSIESNFLVSWTLTGLVIDLVLDLTESVYDNLVTAS
jgi:hypothetical protein